MDPALTPPAAPAPLAEATPGAAPALPLAARIEHINTLAAQVAVAEERARAAGQAAWQLAVILGHALCECKAACPHGEFSALFKNHSKTDTCVRFALSQRNARRYMSLYREAAAWCKRHSLSMCGGTLPAEADIPADLSMRGALDLFREEPPGTPTTPGAPAPSFAAPNTAGRIRAQEGQLSEADRIAARERSATAELDALARHLEEYIISGRHTLADAPTRRAAEAVFALAIQKLKATK